MINFFNPKNRIQKIQAAQQSSLISMNSNGHGIESNLSDFVNAVPMKILSGQILAMAEQDNKTPIGKKLDIFT